MEHEMDHQQRLRLQARLEIQGRRVYDAREIARKALHSSDEAVQDVTREVWQAAADDLAAAIRECADELHISVRDLMSYLDNYTREALHDPAERRREDEDEMAMTHAQMVDDRGGYLNVRQWETDEEQAEEAAAITAETDWRIVGPVVGWTSPSGITYTHLIVVEDDGTHRLVVLA